MGKPMLLFTVGAVFIAACAAGNYGKIKKLPPDEAQTLTSNLESAWETYDIRVVPNRAVLLTPKAGDNTLAVGSEWTTVANRATWEEMIRQNTTPRGDIRTWFPSSGFRKIEDPSGNFYGIIAHANRDLVSARVLDAQTMRLFYTPARTSGPSR